MNKLLAVGIASLLIACASTPPTNFYVLEAISQPSVSPSSAKKMLIGIGPLTLPTLLERRQIVTRKANNSIELAEFHQWAAPLRDSILAVLSQNLAVQQPNALVKAYPWAAYGEMDYRVIIDISRFDSELGKSATLQASWAIMTEKNHTIIHSGQTRLEQPLDSNYYESVVAALNQLLNKFSQQLALALHQLPPHSDN
jgi:uncharacterized protein